MYYERILFFFDHELWAVHLHKVWTCQSKHLRKYLSQNVTVVGYEAIELLQKEVNVMNAVIGLSGATEWQLISQTFYLN